MKRVLAAMSGGVDSAVAAALMQRAGYEVIGVTMTLASPGDGDGAVSRGCCSVWDVTDAEKVAWKLGIRHYVFNLRREFEERVIGDFVSEYARGRTPNPCRRCNQHIKFDVLMRRARMMGAELLVTGHHARLRLDSSSGRLRLWRGRDRRKDQSYVLAVLTPDQLADVRFPVGEYTKDEVREVARELGLSVAEKPESQDLCFIPDGDTAAFLSHRLADPRPGPIRDTSGRVLGRHPGLAYYTVGQRKGLRLSAPRPYYVLRLEVADNSLVVGPAEEMEERGMEVEEVVWHAPRPVRRAEVQYRSSTPPAPADLEEVGEGRVRVRFDRPQRALAPGQAAVFYRGDEVLGGGIIRATTARDRD